ncbi:MAG: hypothetical protein ACT452_19545 [Microthrixaceae bacterium]
MNVVIPVLGVGLWLGFLYVWIDALIGVARIPESAFRRGVRAKAFWIALIALTGVVGIIVWNYWGHARAIGSTAT